MAFTLDQLYNMQNGDEDGAGKNVEQQSVVDQNDAHFETATAEEHSAVNAEAGALIDSLQAEQTSQTKRIRDLEAKLQEAVAERDVLHDKLADARENQSDPFQEEMIELLRTEVTQLQTEVSERDALLQTYKGAPTGEPTDSGVNEEEVQKLCERLEDLLAELEQKDNEVTVLQKHLQCAEDANAAEQDERRQLENWVGEIEERITSRDREWEEKLSEMQMRLTQARTERREAETAAGAASNDTRLEALQRVVSDLRDEKDDLTQQLDERQDAISRLETQVEQAKVEAARQESVEMCQERAELARQRFELERKKQDMEEQKAVEGSDLRIRALRDHLKEVQATEKEEQREAFETSLAGRISRLWRRIEDR